MDCLESNQGVQKGACYVSSNAGGSVRCVLLGPQLVHCRAMVRTSSKAATFGVYLC